MAFNDSLAKVDSQVAGIINRERERLNTGLVMIPSESMASVAVMEATGSVLTSKYAEGYPKKRYYTGAENVDDVEMLAIERAKSLFGCEHVNVQPHSGSNANLQAYAAVLNPGDKVMGMRLDQGGHLTHGHPVNLSGRLYQFTQYGVDPETQLIDMDVVRKTALEVKPKIIVSGATAYPRAIDFKAFHEIALEAGAYSMADIAHIAGLIVGGAHASPLPFTDLVTTTTHKTLCGPRSAIIMCRDVDRLAKLDGLDEKGAKQARDLGAKVDKAVFPGSQGGPLEHVIAAKAVCFKQAATPEFKAFAQQIVKNSRALADSLMDGGLKLVTGGTDNHLVLIDLTPFGPGLGLPVSEALARAGIFTNRNTVPFDPSTPFKPSGVRLGTPVLTQRGMGVDEMKQVGTWIAAIAKNPGDEALIAKTRGDVNELCKRFPLYA